MTEIQTRMKELCKPVEQQITFILKMCDSSEEILMMACAMLTHVKEEIHDGHTNRC